MFKWKKLGRIFNPTEIKNKSWMKEFAQSPSVLIFDKFKIKNHPRPLLELLRTHRPAGAPAYGRNNSGPFAYARAVRSDCHAVEL